MPELNTDILQAQPIIIKPMERIELWVVGCGGTGSFLVQLLCRVLLQLIEQGKQAKLVLVDPDTVEPKNLTRQCFCAAEVGLNKAQALAARYSLAFGLPIEAIALPFKADMVAQQYGTLTLLLGCVDNAQARSSLAKALEFNDDQNAPHLWWIDGGNGHHFGQVLAGSCLSRIEADYTFHQLGCMWLPAPSVQAPDLLVPRPEETEPERLSCAELGALNLQSPLVNPQVAILLAEFALELLQGKLKRFAVHFDQTTGRMESSFITPKAIAQSLSH